MSEPADVRVGSAGATTAGGLIRQARQAQGLHIAALAAAIKVTPRKLELLEADRFGELPDATFARALANAVCRHLKIDAGPVMALLPPQYGQEKLERVAEGLKMPFREHGDRMAEREAGNWITNPVVWGPAIVIVGLAAIYFAPAHWTALRPASTPASGVAATALPPGAAPAASEAAAPAVVTQTIDLTPPPAASDAAAPQTTATTPTAPAETAAAPAETAASGVIQLQASAESWVGITDATGRSLVARTVKAGEALGFDGTPPFKVTVGNARGTQLTFRGKPVDLTSRDNVARLELK
jgi:cytoskeleton protein RodZ